MHSSVEPDTPRTEPGADLDAEGGPDAIIVADRRSRIVAVNHGAETLFGHRGIDLVGQPLDMLLPERLRRHRYTAESFLASARAESLASRGELHGLRKDGQEIRIAVGLIPFDTPGGRYTVASIVDRTERRRRRMMLAARDSSNGTIIVGLNRRIVLMNRHAEELFGYTMAELVGQPLEMLVPASIDGLLTGDFATLQRGSGFLRRDLIGLRKGGMELHLEITLTRVDSAGEPFVVAAVADISERRRGEEIQQRMTALVESADDAILTKTLDGVVRTWNPAATRLLGYAPEEIVGRPVTVLIPEDRLDEETMILDRIRRGQRVAHFETLRRRRDGTLVDVSLTISPIRDRAGLVIGASKIMRDITDRRRVMERLSALNDQLNQQIVARTTELKERGALLQEVHHRVKNNLQVISSLINMQVRSIKDPATRTALQECQSRVSTMAQIHEMLYQAQDYARIPFAKYCKTLTERLLSALVTSSSDIRLEFDLEPVSLIVDEAIPCGLILNELVANALKHAFPDRAGGVIRVGLRRGPGGMLSLAVSDDGIGLPDDFLPEKASSLGVHLVLALAKQLDGSVRFERGRGAKVCVTFPVKAPQ